MNPLDHSEVDQRRIVDREAAWRISTILVALTQSSGNRNPGTSFGPKPAQRLRFAAEHLRIALSSNTLRLKIHRRRICDDCDL